VAGACVERVRIAMCNIGWRSVTQLRQVTSFIHQLARHGERTRRKRTQQRDTAKPHWQKQEREATLAMESQAGSGAALYISGKPGLQSGLKGERESSWSLDGLVLPFSLNRRLVAAGNLLESAAVLEYRRRGTALARRCAWALLLLLVGHASRAHRSHELFSQQGNGRTHVIGRRRSNGRGRLRSWLRRW
jgi:hypothetical protein